MLLKKVPNAIDIFITVSLAALFRSFCKEFSELENEKKQETNLGCFKKK